MTQYNMMLYVDFADSIGQLIAIITYKLHLKLSMTLFEQLITQK